jgi:hypothetical protein
LKRQTERTASRGSPERPCGAVFWRGRQHSSREDSILTASRTCRGGHVPKHRLIRPISIATATWSRVADGFDKTAETSSHFVDALSRSPVHPVSNKANSRVMILIRAVYPDLRSLSGFLGHYWAALPGLSQPMP